MHAKEKAWGHTLRFQIKAQQDQSTHLLACLLTRKKRAGLLFLSRQTPGLFCPGCPSPVAGTPGVRTALVPFGLARPSRSLISAKNEGYLAGLVSM